ncbi:MAG: hypothetical protein U1F43_33570 [Myxococcota bacterium]
MRLSIVISWAALSLAACGSTNGARDSGADGSGPTSTTLISGDDAVARVLDAVRAVPEVQALEARMRADGVALIGRLDSDPDEPAPSVWEVYVGEDHPDHTVRLWSFKVDARSGAMSVVDPVTLEEQSFDAWKKALAANPP